MSSDPASAGPRTAKFQIGAIVRGLPGPEGEMPPEEREKRRREARVLIPRSDTVIESNDHVIVFLPRKRDVREVEKLFQVSATFL